MTKKEKIKSKKKRKKSIRIIVSVVAVAVIATGAIVFIPRLIDGAEDNGATLQKRTAIVAQGDVVQTLGSSAPIESSITENIKSGIQGEVLEIMVEDSDIVDAGTIIMTLDTSSTDSSIESLQDQIDSKTDQIEEKNDTISSKYSLIEDKEEEISSKYDDIDEYLEEIESIDEEIFENEASRSNLEIYAPVSGSIFNLSVSEGDTVNTTKVIATITDTASYSVEMAFNAALLEKDIQSVTISQLSNDFPGTIESISGYTYKDEFSNEKVDIIISFDTGIALKEKATVTAVIEADGFTYYSNVKTTPYYDTNADIVSEISGEILELNITEKQFVTEGELLVVIDGEIIDDTSDSLASQKENLQEQLEGLYDSIDDLKESILGYYEDITDLREEITELEEDITDLQQEIDEIKEEYEKAVITADFDGIVSSIKVSVGDTVNANTTLFSLISLENPSIIVSIDELDIAEVTIGMEAEVTIDALSFTETSPVSAVVSKISPEGNYQNGVTTFNVTVTLIEPVDGLMLNMNATATIYVGKSEDTLYIPIEAVSIQGTKKYVYIQDETAVESPVSTVTETGSETVSDQAAAVGGQRQAGGFGGNINTDDMTDEQKAQLEQRLAERGLSADDIQGSQASASESIGDIADYYAGTRLVEVTTGIYNEMYIEILSGLEIGDVVVLPPLYTSSVSTSTTTENTSGILMPGMGSFGGTGTGTGQRPTGGAGGGN